MFFFARSAVCIGVVVAMSPSAGRLPRLGDVADAAGQAATTQIRSLCTASTTCISAGMSLVEAAMASAPAQIPPPPRIRGQDMARPLGASRSRIVPRE